MKCNQCGNEMSATRESYLYAESGLPNVILMNVEVRTCPACGTNEVAIPRVMQLHRNLALCLANKEAQLIGAEIRFLRKHIGWSGADFARHFGFTPETISRWENDKEPMGAAAERLLRVLAVRDQPVESYPNERLLEVARTKPVAESLSATATSKGWNVAPRAA